jgi:hypothetical protein
MPMVEKMLAVPRLTEAELLVSETAVPVSRAPLVPSVVELEMKLPVAPLRLMPFAPPVSLMPAKEMAALLLVTETAGLVPFGVLTVVAPKE